jgi:cobalt-zinc-cadmium efflux system outer membrane protein
MLQVRVEEQQFLNDLLTAQADAEKASIALSSFLGANTAGTRLIARGNLDQPARELDVPKLMADALRDRPDLVALRRTRDAALSKVREERANRIPNLDVGAGWTHSTSSQNSIAPSPEFDSINLSLSLPIPLWNRNHAAIASARFTAEQAQTQLEAAELKAQIQIRQADCAYRSALERVHHYQSGILKDADAVLEAKRFSYQKGQSSLLELLEAQRTDNEVRSSYNDALADQAKALIELERSAHIWEIQF